MTNANATYYHLIGPWTLSDSLGYMAAHQENDAYTESDGTRRAETTINLGELQAGGQAAYITGIWEPYAGAELTHEFAREDNSVTTLGANLRFDF